MSITPKAIFEDDSILVLDKPAGLVVTRSETQDTATLEDLLINDYKITLDRGGIVHRLDKDTSGVIVVAKTQSALEDLQLQFKTRRVSKEYLALVHGLINEGGEIKGELGRNPFNREKFAVLEEGEGKEAITHYQPLKKLTLPEDKLKVIFDDFNKIQFRKLGNMNYTQFTLVSVHPLTGRTHQIRVHLKYLGFGIVGDSKYTGRKIARLDKRWCPRQFLHACKLQICHPETGEKLEFISELPQDLKQALDFLDVTN